MKKLLSILLLSFSFTLSIDANAQFCVIDVTPLDTTICPGDSVFINAYANIISSGQAFNFNGGALPAGWSTSGGSTFSAPCDPSLDNTPYYWASTSTTSNPAISTAAFDVSCGGVITFDMDYATQSQTSPCEGPDEADEGVSLQYSTNGGTTWYTIVYYSPDGFEYPANPFVGGGVLPPGNVTNYTSWSSFAVTIPPAALSTTTMFRWVQESPTSGSAFDNWGVDNIVINATGLPCGSAIVNWNNGLMDTTSWVATPSTDTAFVAYVYDTLGNLQCTSDSIFITIIDDNMSYNLVDSVFMFCPNDSTTAEVLNIQGAQIPVSTVWTTGSTTTSTWLPSGPNKQDTIVHYVDIVDACGYARFDSVVVVVNQTLAIDTLFAFPTSACDMDGAVSAIVSGEMNGPGSNSFYHWDDQANWDNQGSGSFNDATAWQNIGSGWYYFTVTDDVCTETDSVFVDMENPPIASLSASPIAGCNGLNVSFSNTSQNTTYYYWDFGNGNDLYANDQTGQSQIYNQTSTVMLIAYTDQTETCGDTAYVEITITECGCTDPTADNYNPAAVQDDGSCVYPTPVVTAPNIFTPNNDGDNDIYFFKLKNVVNFQYSIVNRWGNVMFEQTLDPTILNLNVGWNGTTPLGIPAEEGTYFYQYVATGINGDVVDGHGFVQLARD